MTETTKPMTGKDFTAWREAEGLSQRAAEEKTGINRRTMTNWETGGIEPPLWVGYVCAAVSAGLPPWPERKKSSKRKKRK